MNNRPRISLQERITTVFIDEDNSDLIEVKEQSSLRATLSLPVNDMHQLRNFDREYLPSLTRESQVKEDACLFVNLDKDAKQKQSDKSKPEKNSCSCYENKLCFDRNINSVSASSTELILESNYNRSSYYFNLETFTKPNSVTVSKVITKEPPPPPFTPIQYSDNCCRSSSCTFCLYNTKGCISYCTCFCCLEALCYHCVTKDDIGTNHIVRNALNLNEPKRDVGKRLAICFACIPFLPCLSLYPILNGVIDFCMDKSNKN